MNAIFLFFFPWLIPATATVSGVSGETNYYMSLDPILKPSRTTEVLTSAIWFDISQYDLTQVDAPFISICAIKAKVFRAVAFAFEDGNCILVGSGEGYKGQLLIYQDRTLPFGDTLEEVAKSKATFASKYYRSWTKSDKAVDGGYGDVKELYHSDLATKPWWQVDLGKERLISQIQILTRQNKYGVRFHDVEVRVGSTLVEDEDLSSYTLLCTYTKVYELGEGHLLCFKYGGITGRYVSIQITAGKPEYLQLVEVSVFAVKK